MSTSNLTRFNPPHLRYWRIGGIIIGIYLLIGVAHLVISVLAGEFSTRVSLSGLSVIDCIAVVCVFYAWIVHYGMIIVHLVFFFLFRRCTSYRDRRRFANKYAVIVGLVCLLQSASVLYAMNGKVFWAVGATYSVDSWLQVRGTLAISWAMMVPALALWIGTRFRHQEQCCKTCGYELEQGFSRCPECGASHSS
jgi:hypothetical protein